MKDLSTYKFVGWMNGWHLVYFDANHNETKDPDKTESVGYLEKDHPEYIRCRKAGHKTEETQKNQRGSENIVSCDVCKIYWKYDSSG
jgi:hypothetical protein